LSHRKKPRLTHQMRSSGVSVAQKAKILKRLGMF
jgi:hypothetical protein